MNSAIRLLYSTFENAETARGVAHRLLEERCIACANVFPGVQSVFRWEGAIRVTEEAVLIAKTTQERVPQALERLRALHPYDCPCVVALDVTTGHAPFLQWVAGEVLPTKED